MGYKIWADYRKSFGSYVYCTKSQRSYLDFMNHYSSLPLGYDRLPQKFYDEISDAAHIKTSLGVYNVASDNGEFLKEFYDFAAPAGFEFFHLCCTGSLAVEAAIKTAWAHSGYEKNFVISLRNSFHGVNALGNFITTSDRLSKTPGMLPGKPLTYWGLNVEEKAIRSLVEYYSRYDELAAVVIEPVQCTHGDKYLDKELLHELREITSRYDVPLIFDEVQSGFGTTGKVWYYEHIGVEPDIIVFGKKSQVSGILVKEGFGEIFNDPMRLSVTYDGEYMDCIRCKYIIREIKEKNLLLNIYSQGDALIKYLEVLPYINNVRGVGGLIAFDFSNNQERDLFRQKCFEQGLLVNTAGEKTIRLRPNLAVTNDDISACFLAIKNVINKIYL